MNISNEVMLNVFNDIKARIEHIYIKYVNELDIDLFIEDVLETIKIDITEFSEVTDEILSSSENRINKTKSRWYKKELLEKEGLNKEIELAKKVQDKITDTNKFQIIYDGVKNLDELKEKKMKDLDSWYNDKEKLLSDYIYMNTKKTYQIRLALINDIKYIALNAIKANIDSSKSSLIINMPHSVSNIPIDYTNRATINMKHLDNIVTEGNKEYFINKYYIDDNTVFESLIDTEILHNDVIKNFIGTLNLLDSTILSYLLSVGQSDEMFYSTREVVVGISNIINYCGLTDGVKNYISIKESLYKMQYLTSGVFDSSLRGFTVKILDNVLIYTADNKSMVKATFNIDIINQLVKTRTIRMYKDVIDNFELPTSKILILRLQRERVAASLKENESLFMKVNMNFFRGALYFSDKKKYRNIKVVEETLNEIIKHKITLKSYKRNGDNFLLEFFPFSEKEKYDLLKQLE